MASLFDLLHGLTKVEVVGPDGNPQFYNPPEQNSKNALAFLGGVEKQNAQAVEPSTDTHNVQLPTEGSAAIPPELQAILGGQPQAQGTPRSESVSQQDNQHPLSFLRPNFQQASSDAVGLPNAKSPALTTKGKTLLTLLQGGLGALAGSDQRTAAGGYRAAVEEPVQRVAQRQALERGGLENQVLGAQVQMLPWERVAKLAALQKINAETGKAQAEGQKATAEAGRVPSQQALDEANALKAQFQEFGGEPYQVGVDPVTHRPTLTPVDQASNIPVGAELAKVLNLPPGTHVPIKKAIEAADLLTKGTTNFTSEEGVFEHNRITGKNTRLGSNPRMVFAPENKIIPVGDPNNPGNVIFEKAGQAVASGAQSPQSASVQVPRTAMKSEVPTNIGNQKLAFNTALAHADLLKQAISALNNGNIQTINSIGNRFNTEFGGTGQLTYQSIADAYTREVNKMLSGGHMTDADLRQVGSTLPSKGSPQQQLAVVEAYRKLAASKIQQLDKQKNAAIQGSQPKGMVAAPSAGAVQNPHADIGFVPANQ